jgi:predicted phosphodiesterase
MIALLYDIHGNDVALAAVIDHARAAGADAWLLGGDYCMMGAQPAAVLDRLEGLPADTVWLRGNTERWALHPDAADIPSDAVRDAALFTAGAIGADSVRELAELPHVVANVPFNGASMTVFCHASPGSDMIGFTDREADTDGAAAASSYEANTIVGGHTHVQFSRAIGVLQIVNPGSVGMPFDGDQRASYALLAPDGSFALHRVEYDVAAAVAAYRDLASDWVDLAKKRLLAAQF